MSVEGVTRRTLGVALVVAVVLSVATGGAIGAGDAGEPSIAAAQPDDGGDNESAPPPHRNPDEVREEGDIAGVEAALAGWLGSRVGESVIAINEEEYERGRELIGDDYDDALGQYVEVTRETGSERTAERFGEAERTTQDLANESEEFTETYEEYQEARENGDEERARELARDLDEQATEINETARELNAILSELEALTGEDFSDAQTAALEVAAEREAIASDVTRETLTATRLLVTANRTTGTFLEPVGLTGRLTTEDGTPIANETVRIAVGDQTDAVDTDGDGRFQVAYRPVRLAVPAERLAVAFRPSRASRYAGVTTEATVRIEGITPTTAITDAPDTVAFGEQVAVAGWVRAGPEETPVPGVPFVAMVDDVVIANGTTGPDGRYRVTGRLPGSIPAGDATIRVRIDQEDRAVGTDSHEVAVTVRPTDTELSVNAEAADGRVRAAGRLTTADGTPLGSRTVRLLVNGTVVETAGTDGDGVYRAAAALPADVDGGDTIRVTVAFDGTDTSFADGSVTTLVTVPAGEGGGLAGRSSSVVGDLLAADDEGAQRAVIAVLAVLALLGTAALLVRRRDLDVRSEDAAAGGTDRAAADEPSSPGETDDQSHPLDRARERLPSDGTAAVRAAYGTVRERFSEEANVPESATHWELYLAAGDRLDDEREAALERLTEAYERAEFAPVGIDGAEAEAAVEAAAAVLDR